MHVPLLRRRAGAFRQHLGDRLVEDGDAANDLLAAHRERQFAEFGLIVLARLLLPSGLLAIIDFGLPEVTTQVVARAREHRDWAVAGSQLLLLTIVSVLLAATLSGLMWFATRIRRQPVWQRLPVQWRRSSRCVQCFDSRTRPGASGSG